MSFIHKLLATVDSWPLLIARLTLGLVMLPHGLQKTFGLFGGQGFSATMQGMSEGLGIPAALVFLAILAEFAGSLFLIFGALGRIAALGIGVTMAVAMSMHVKNGFFMNWYGANAGEGYEYHLLAIGLALAVIVGGSGALSLDHSLGRPLAKDKAKV
ncbi:DoxX family protein [bacterium]|nr:DoxX family protein [bacterium]